MLQDQDVRRVKSHDTDVAVTACAFFRGAADQSSRAKRKGYSVAGTDTSGKERGIFANIALPDLLPLSPLSVGLSDG